MGGLLMLIISTILKVAFAPVLYFFGALISFLDGDFNQWNFDLAVAKDQYGNTLGKYVFNSLLITKQSTHFFGNNDETISSVIGKNKVDKTLTFIGKFVDKLLDLIDPNHSIKAIDDTE